MIDFEFGNDPLIDTVVDGSGEDKPKLTYVEGLLKWRKDNPELARARGVIHIRNWRKRHPKLYRLREKAIKAQFKANNPELLRVRNREAQAKWRKRTKSLRSQPPWGSLPV